MLKYIIREFSLAAIQVLLYPICHIGMYVIHTGLLKIYVLECTYTYFQETSC